MTDVCTMCGRTFSEPSMGGPGICPACDCGLYDPQSLLSHIQRLTAERDALQAQVEAAKAILRPLYECDPAVRVWFGDPAYGPVAKEQP